MSPPGPSSTPSALGGLRSVTPERTTTRSGQVVDQPATPSPASRAAAAPQAGAAFQASQAGRTSLSCVLPRPGGSWPAPLAAPAPAPAAAAPAAPDPAPVWATAPPCAAPPASSVPDGADDVVEDGVDGGAASASANVTVDDSGACVSADGAWRTTRSVTVEPSVALSLAARNPAASRTRLASASGLPTTDGTAPVGVSATAKATGELRATTAPAEGAVRKT